MDKEFLDQYPEEMTQGLRTVLDKLEEETDEVIRAKLYGQLALGLERLKSMIEDREPHGVEQIWNLE